MMSTEHAIQLMYPYTILLGHEGKMAVEGVLKVSTVSPSFPSSSFHFPFPLPVFPVPLFSLPFFSFFVFPSLLSQERKHWLPKMRKQWWETRSRVCVWRGTRGCYREQISAVEPKGEHIDCSGNYRLILEKGYKNGMGKT